MMEPAPEQSLKSKVIETKLIDWQKLEFLQDDNFKDLSYEAKEKLRTSILTFEFTQPFYVWQDQEGTLYCLDGRHRSIILQDLLNEHFDIPAMLPGTFMACKDKQDAAKLVLQYSSIYARISEAGFVDFLEAFNLDREQMETVIDLPGLEFNGTEPLPMPEEFEDDFKNKPAVMKITFESPEQLQEAENDVRELLDRKYQGAFFSVSCGEI